MKDSFLLYKLALKAHYEKIKGGVFSAFLISPTPANLRKLCLIIYQENPSEDDLITFRNFFGFDYSHSIEIKLKQQTDKFKPIQTFLLKGTELENISSADMTAVLLQHKERPYRKFLKKLPAIDDLPKVKETAPENNSITNFDSLTPIDSENKIQQAHAKINFTNRFKTQLFYSGLFLLLLTGCLFTWNLVSDKKQCMQWQNDHYEVVDCSDYNPEFTTQVIALDTALLKFRKIHPKKDSAFMSEGKITIWYCKNNGVEFFNADGKHPLTGKNLGPVSAHIMNKYGR